MATDGDAPTIDEPTAAAAERENPAAAVTEEELDPAAAADEASPFGSLDDECAFELLRRLPLKERLAAEAVCRRWRRVLSRYCHAILAC